MEKTGGTYLANFRDNCMQEIATVKAIVQADIFLFDIDIVDGSLISELARRNIGKNSDTVRLWCCNSLISYVSNIIGLVLEYRCPTYDQFIKKAGNLVKQMTTCKEGVKHVFPMNLYQLRETLFHLLYPSGISYSDDRKIFNKLTIFGFESNCVQEKKLHDTDTLNWVCKQSSTSTSLSSNFIEGTTFFCISYPRDFVQSIVGALDDLLTQSKGQLKSKMRPLWRANSIEISLLLIYVAVANND